MKVIFVASGNKRVGKVSAFVQSQYDSLVDEGLEMVLFPVVGKGLKGHLKAILSLRKVLKREKPDITLLNATAPATTRFPNLFLLGLPQVKKLFLKISQKTVVFLTKLCILCPP